MAIQSMLTAAVVALAATTAEAARRPGRLADLGFKVGAASAASSDSSELSTAASTTTTGPDVNGIGLYWDNAAYIATLPDNAAEEGEVWIRWANDTDEAEIEEYESLTISGLHKRHLGKRSVDHSYLSTFNFTGIRMSAFNGLSDEEILDIMDDKRILSCEYVKDIVPADAVAQTNAPSGLVRLSNTSPAGDYYIFDESAGSGITTYIIDSGVNVDHSEFSGRAIFGANLVPGTPDVDENGHGTHVAGTIAGRTFGVAKNSSIIAIKIFDATGAGASSSVLVQAMQFVKDDVAARGIQGKAIVNMSLGTPTRNRAMNEAIDNLVNDGILAVVAAGNEAVDAANSSPASASLVMTVGAIDARSDRAAPFSNFGSVVDIHAPGVNIISAGFRTNTATATLSGTSMACPHVAGLAAYLMGLEGLSTPDAIKNRITELATQSGSKATGFPSDTTTLIANNGFLG